jgi:hypothetical protein
VYCVHLFLIDQAFGGHEEGGWWYHCGTPQDHPKNKSFASAGDADRYKKTLEDLEDELNEGRAEVSSVLSQGCFRFLVCYGEAKPFPEVKPHYE